MGLRVNGDSEPLSCPVGLRYPGRMTGLELRTYRLNIERLGLTPFARLLGVCPSAVSRWENGSRKVPVSVVQLLTSLPPPLVKCHAKTLRRFWAFRPLDRPAYLVKSRAKPVSFVD